MLRRIPPLILVIVLLAIYGFLLTFISDPINTLIILGLSVALFLLVRNYLRTGSFFPKSAGSGTPKQQKAKPKPPVMRQAHKKQSTGSRKEYPFRVIDGNKGKSKEKQGEKSQNNISH
ncbi:hypothetical protein [Brevibacillus gelatini]|uniref:DUF2207 domain-containing protein n=1 Tax=Brevibacillus gelatini TaxID=1655277 RepID=A0A3M8B5H7_9BACL|nr:hypothetical protein [Brevibacillus gelatini]RNB58513.1 hypothetical protein EDM57_07245 [Brevibacillus gelatini]